jgi:hypothetical protein
MFRSCKDVVLDDHNVPKSVVEFWPRRVARSMRHHVAVIVLVSWPTK